MDTDSETLRIRAQRTVARRAVTRARQELEELINDVGASVDLQTAASLLSEKVGTLQRIDNLYMNSVTGLQEEELVEELQRAEEYVDSAQRQLHRAQAILSERASSVASKASIAESVASDASSKPPHAINLPQLELPTFDGDPMKWRPFWDQFRAAVDCNPSLSSVRKHMYLTSRLRGQARDAVDGIPITEANYDAVVTELNRRFGNPNMLIGLHADRLVSVSRVEETDVLSFRRLIDTFDRSLREIEQLISEDKGLGSLHDLLLAPLLLQKIPSSTRLEWNRRNPHALQRFDLAELRQFIRCEVETMEALSSSRPSQDEGQRRAARQRPTVSPSIRSTTAALTSGQYTPIYNLPVGERLQAVKLQRRCLNCLRQGHRKAECPSRSNCRTCNARHHTCLHDCMNSPSPLNNSASSSPQPSQRTPATESLPSSVVNFGSLEQVSTNEQPRPTAKPLGTCPRAVNLSAPGSASMTQRILLQTAVVCASAVQPNGAREIRARVLIDGGSELSYVTGKLAQCLNAKSIERRSFVIEGFGGHSTSLMNRDRVLLRLHNRNRPNSPILCKLWVTEMICNPLRGPGNVKDELPAPLRELPLAEDYADDLLSIDIVLGQDCLHAIFIPAPPIICDSVCAWDTVFGWVVSGRLHTPGTDTLMNFARTACLRASASTIDPSSLWDLEHIGVRIPDSSVSPLEKPRWSHDRYEISLPWLDGDRPALCPQQAQTRLKQFFHLPPAQQEAYRKVLSEWIDLGVIEPASLQGGNFLPHHGVVQGDKLRVVVDASASPWKGSSLNDTLHPGPSVSLDLVAVLLRFRTYLYAMTADLQRAFLTIGIEASDRRFLKLLLPSGKPYQFSRLPFGLNCAPAILHHVIQHHLKVDAQSSEERSTNQQLLNGLYVDDLLIGSETITDLSTLKQSAEAVFASAGMTLRKFATSEPTLKESWCPDTQIVKVLGICWNLESDTLAINTQPSIKETVTTRRQLLSVASRSFDPLGLISPWSINFRFLIQSVWRSNEHLDDPLPQEITHSVTALLNELPEIARICCPRRISQTSLKSSDCNLLTFVDASEKAYAACVYLSDTTHGTRLIFSRARLAPLKRKLLTLPRLELMAAVLGCRILTYVRNSIPELKSISCRFFSDSMIVLGWIRGYSRDLFVRNRIQEIRVASASDSWHHIPTSINPADLPTRGMTADQLRESSLWWYGPPELASPTASLPTLTTTTTAVSSELPWLPTENWSTWSKACRVIAYVLRFIENARSKSGTRLTSALSNEENRKATVVLVKDCQRGLDLNEADPRLRLALNENGIVVSHFRSGEEPLPYVPSSSTILPLIIREIHLRLYHQGANSTAVEFSRSYVTPRLRRRVKAILHNCVPCRKMNSRPYRTAEGSLPDFRSTANRAFAHTGVDHFGPLFIRDASKVWILLFTCAVTRAIHLEVVNSLDETHTSLALRRFMALRGPVSTFYSDNGTSFTCLKKRLQNEISWCLIPVRSPWWGGFWERLVGTVKRALSITLSRTLLNLTELQTVVAECAERINRRPLCSNGCDGDAEPITPAHFVYGCSPPALTDHVARDQLPEHPDLGRRWKHRLLVADHFWKRWQREYLSTLRVWRTSDRAAAVPKEGDIVLIDSKPTSRSRWPVGRVVRVHPGRDGNPRSADIVIKGRASRRAIKMLHPLEVT